MKDGNMFLALFNIGLDPIDEISLVTDESVSEVLSLSASGEWSAVSFTKDGGNLTVHHSAATLDPVVLILKK
jgi:hypothetical protein